MARYLRWPLQVGGDGRFVTISSPDDVWSNRVAQLVAARYGERVMRPEYGTNVPADIFENNLKDPTAEIDAALKKWLPHITLESVKIIQDKDFYQLIVNFMSPDKTPLTASVDVAVPGEG